MECGHEDCLEVEPWIIYLFLHEAVFSVLEAFIFLWKVKEHRVSKTGFCVCASVYIFVYFIYDADLFCNEFAFLHHEFLDNELFICPAGWAKMLIVY